MNAKNLIGGFIVGAALGAAAGLLLAPASGEKTRRRLVKGSTKLKNNVVSYVEDSIDSLRTQVNKRIDQLSGKAKDGVNFASDKMESVAAKARNHG